MIRRAWNKDKWLLTPQAEHARIAGLMAASWNFASGKPLDQVFQAIVRHDDGWKSYEETPGLNEAGAPISFDEMDLLDAIPIWTQCSAPMLAEDRPYAARLVAAHFIAMARKSGDMARMSPRKSMAVGNFIGEQQALMRKCGEKPSPPPQPVPAVSAPVRGITLDDMMFAKPPEFQEPEPQPPEDTDESDSFHRDLRFLQVCDQLSILLCSEFFGEIEIEDVPYLNGTDKLRVIRQADNLSMQISPLPFKKNLRDHVMSYVVPRRIFGAAEEVHELIRNGKLTSNEIHVGAA